MGEYNPKKKDAQSSWRGLKSRLPTTISTFQIVIIAGFLSVLVLKSAIGIGNSAAQTRSSVSSDEGTGSIRAETNSDVVQRAKLEIEKLRKEVAKQNAGREIEAPPVEVATENENEIENFEREEVRIMNEREGQSVARGTVDDVEELERREAEEQRENEKREAVERIENEKREAEEQIENEKREGEEQEDEKRGREEQREDEKREVEEQTEVEKIEEAEQEEPREEVKEEQTVDEIDVPKDEEKEAQRNEVEEQKENSLKQNSVRKIEEDDVDAALAAAAETANISVKSSEKLEKVKEEAKEKKEKEETKEKEEKEKEKRSDDSKAAKDAEEKKPAMSREEAIAKMNKIMRRDEPNAYTLGPKISNWDEQRAEWLEKHPEAKTTDPHKPNVLLVSGTQPLPCKSPVGDHYLLKMMKNKVDYARIHKMEMFYNLAHLDKEMSRYWAKLPIMRKLMLIHPETEWIFWVDSDAMFTDMVFEIPFEKYEGKNFVMMGWENLVYEERSWVACNTGVFFIRNCQWTLDLLEMWSHLGTEGIIRKEAGELMSSYLSKRGKLEADDQSALVFLLATRPELRSKVFLERDYWLSGYWVDLVNKYEEFSAKSRPGAGGYRWPFTTHFTGCQPCSGGKNPNYEGSSCLDGMERAFNFADNQVLKPFGFQHLSLEEGMVKRIRNETTKPLRTVPLPNPWAVDSFY